MMIIKDSGFLNSRFLSCNTTLFMCKCHLAVFLLCCGNYRLENRHKNANTLATATSVNKKWFFVFDPGVVCLLPVRIKLWQANLLASMQGKTQTFHNPGKFLLYYLIFIPFVFLILFPSFLSLGSIKTFSILLFFSTGLKVNYSISILYFSLGTQNSNSAHSLLTCMLLMFYT